MEIILSFFFKDEAFTSKDIITIQDPTNLEKRTVVNFDYIKNNLILVHDEGKNQNSSQFINQNQTAKRIFDELEKTKMLPEENPIKKLKLDQPKEFKVETFKNETDINSTNV